MLVGLIVFPLLWGQSFAQSTSTLTAAGPLGVSNVNVSIVGNQGNSQYYYWVVANFTIGQGQISKGVTIRNAPNILSSGNYIMVSWSPVSGAVSYDLLRTTANNEIG